VTTEFILVRHGQTALNAEGRFRGRKDVGLDELGLRQALAVGQRIAAGWTPAAIWSGPLRRSMQTAEAIGAATGLPAQADDGLQDLNYGEFAGLTPAEAEERFPKAYHDWITVPQLVRFPGGESLEDVRGRVAALLERGAREYPDRQVVMVSHTIVLRVLLCDVLGLHAGHVNHFELDTGSISVVRAGGATGWWWRSTIRAICAR